MVGQEGVETAPILILCNKMDIPVGPFPSLGIECGMLRRFACLVAQTAKPLAEMEEALGAWPTTSSRAVTQDACPPARHECRVRTSRECVCPELS